VVVVEVNPIRALAAAMEGYEVMTADDAARVGDVFITVTGNIHAIDRHHFDLMKDGAVLANAGHFDVELNLEALAGLAVGRRILRPNLEEFRLADGRRLLVVAEGRLVNLGAAEGHPADVMDMSFSDQALAAEWVARNAAGLEAKVYRLPPELDHEVARLKLEALGAGLQRLTPEQEDYLGSWRHGT
jgi:adenosylhomocysteinase